MLTLKGHRNCHSSKNWACQYILLFMLRFGSDLGEIYCLAMFFILIECFCGYFSNI